jgi:hypothetical protein
MDEDHKRIIEIIGQHNILIIHNIQTEMLLKYTANVSPLAQVSQYINIAIRYL